MMTNSCSVASLRARLGKRVFPACAGAVLFAAAPVEARGTQEGEERIAECIRQAADGKPWLEKALWGLRDQEAGWLGAEVRNTNGSHDLGPLQINTWWVPKIATLVGRSQADVRVWLMHDACFNAGAARWIFLSALAATDNFWKAVGVYHSPTAWRQRRYALSVARHMQRRFGRDIFAATNVRASFPARLGRTTTDIPSESTTTRVLGFGVVQTTSD